MVIPDSVAVASGGVEAGFTKVSFHYSHGRGLQGCHLVGPRADLRSGFAGRKRHAAVLHGLPLRDGRPRPESIRRPLYGHFEIPVEPVEEYSYATTISDMQCAS